MDTRSPQQILDLLAAGDGDAAKQVFDQYVGRLVGFARRRLSSRIARRVDPEDVVQSAFRSFFRRAESRAFEVEESGELWQLLVVITLNKLHRQVERHSAAKRSVRREIESRPAEGQADFELKHDATEPAGHAELQDELDFATRDFDATQRRMVELRLQGYQLSEIADDVGRSERTVRRTLHLLKQILQQRALQVGDHGP